MGNATEVMTACMILLNQLENLCQSRCAARDAIHKGKQQFNRNHQVVRQSAKPGDL